MAERLAHRLFVRYPGAVDFLERWGFLISLLLVLFVELPLLVLHRLLKDDA